MYKLFFGNVTPYYDEKTFDENYSKVSSYRKEKIDSLSDQKEKARSLTAGLLFDEACKAYGLDMISGQIEDDENGNGRFKCSDDMFPGGKRMYFSISSSEDYVIIGISDGEIGVNIQHITEPVSGIADKYFNEKEQDLYFKANDDEYKEVFYRMWALKSSYISFMGNVSDADVKSMSIIAHMQDCGIWHEEYVYAVTTQDYKAVDEAAAEAANKPAPKAASELHKAPAKPADNNTEKTVAVSGTESGGVEIKNTSNSVTIDSSGKKIGDDSDGNKVTIENKSSGTVISSFPVSEKKTEEEKAKEEKAETSKEIDKEVNKEIKTKETETAKVKEEVKEEIKEAVKEEIKETVKEVKDEIKEVKTEVVAAEDVSSKETKAKSSEPVISKVPDKKQRLSDSVLIDERDLLNCQRVMKARQKRTFRKTFSN